MNYQTGYITDPWSLQMALNATIMQSGDTLYLRGGIYAGDFTCSLMNAITIRPYGTEKPIIDGSVTINGSDTTWEDIEFRYSGWATRRTEISGSEPADIPTTKTLMIYGPRTTLRRCIMHDLAGPGWWIPAGDGLMDECLSYNNGWSAPDRGHGHGLYMQNQTGTKKVKRCVFVQGYSDFAIHAYSEGGSLQGFDVQECVSIGKRDLFGGSVPVDRLSITHCMVWGGSLQTGFNANTHNIAATLVDNILANGAQRSTVGTWDNLVETGTDTTTGNRVLTYGGLAVVFNQALAASVIAPLSGTYRNCQNPAESIVLSAGDLLPMANWTVIAPIGEVSPLASFDPRFAAFMVK